MYLAKIWLFCLLIGLATQQATTGTQLTAYDQQISRTLAAASPDSYIDYDDEEPKKKTKSKTAVDPTAVAASGPQSGPDPDDVDEYGLDKIGGGKDSDTIDSDTIAQSPNSFNPDFDIGPMPAPDESTTTSGKGKEKRGAAGDKGAKKKTGSNPKVGGEGACKGGIGRGQTLLEARYSVETVPAGSTCESVKQTIKFVCEDGVLIQSVDVGDKIYQFTQCNVGCVGATGQIPHLGTEVRTRYKQRGVPKGKECDGLQQTRECKNGAFSSWTPPSDKHTYGECIPAGSGDSCKQLNGKRTADQQFEYVQTYVAPVVPYNHECVQHLAARQCNDGLWNPWNVTDIYKKCTHDDARDCKEGDNTITHGTLEEKRRCIVGTAASESECDCRSATRQCQDGVITQWSLDLAQYPFDSCVVDGKEVGGAGSPAGGGSAAAAGTTPSGRGFIVSRPAEVPPTAEFSARFVVRVSGSDARNVRVNDADRLSEYLARQVKVPTASELLFATRATIVFRAHTLQGDNIELEGRAADAVSAQLASKARFQSGATYLVARGSDEERDMYEAIAFGDVDGGNNIRRKLMQITGFRQPTRTEVTMTEARERKGDGPQFSPPSRAARAEAAGESSQRDDSDQLAAAERARIEANRGTSGSQAQQAPRFAPQTSQGPRVGGGGGVGKGDNSQEQLLELVMLTRDEAEAESVLKPLQSLALNQGAMMDLLRVAMGGDDMVGGQLLEGRLDKPTRDVYIVTNAYTDRRKETDEAYKDDVDGAARNVAGIARALNGKSGNIGVVWGPQIVQLSTGNVVEAQDYKKTVLKKSNSVFTPLRLAIVGGVAALLLITCCIVGCVCIRKREKKRTARAKEAAEDENNKYVDCWQGQAQHGGYGYKGMGGYDAYGTTRAAGQGWGGTYHQNGANYGANAANYAWSTPAIGAHGVAGVHGYNAPAGGMQLGGSAMGVGAAQYAAAQPDGVGGQAAGQPATYQYVIQNGGVAAGAYGGAGAGYVAVQQVGANGAVVPGVTPVQVVYQGAPAVAAGHTPSNSMDQFGGQDCGVYDTVSSAPSPVLPGPPARETEQSTHQEAMQRLNSASQDLSEDNARARLMSTSDSVEQRGEYDVDHVAREAAGGSVLSPRLSSGLAGSSTSSVPRSLSAAEAYRQHMRYSARRTPVGRRRGGSSEAASDVASVDEQSDRYQHDERQEVDDRQEDGGALGLVQQDGQRYSSLISDDVAHVLAQVERTKSARATIDKVEEEDETLEELLERVKVSRQQLGQAYDVALFEQDQKRGNLYEETHYSGETASDDGVQVARE